MEDEPLEQFQAWYREHSGRSQGKVPEESLYAQVRAAFYAGYAARPRPEIKPSRDALDERQRLPRRGDYPVQLTNYFVQARARPAMPGRAPDYVPRGTITGRIPPGDTSAFMTREAWDAAADDYARRAGLEHTDTVWAGPQRDKTAMFRAAWGAPGPVPTPVEDEDG